MDGLILLFYILCIVWSILCLILFFKIWGMTNNVEQLTREVHELRNALAPPPIQKINAEPLHENAPLEEYPSDMEIPSSAPEQEFTLGDIVVLKSNGAHYKVVGFDGDNFIQCQPITKGFTIFDNFKAFKRSDIEKLSLDLRR